MYACCAKSGDLLFAFWSEFVDSKLELTNKTKHKLNLSHTVLNSGTELTLMEADTAQF